MSENIQLDKTTLLKKHKSSNAAGKKILEDLYGKEIFQPKIMDLVKSMTDIYKLSGMNPKAYTAPRNASQDQIADFATRRLKLAISVLNQGWAPDWNNGDQYKYYPYFIWDNKKKGFSFRGVSDGCSGTRVGSRLCFRTSELAEFAGKLFIADYNLMLNN